MKQSKAQPKRNPAKGYAVNRKIKEIIEKKGLKQVDIERRGGFSRTFIYRIIHEKRKVRATEVLPICYALGVSVEELFDETEQPGA